MWTERDKILTQTQEICAYLKEVEHFHDYVIKCKVHLQTL